MSQTVDERIVSMQFDNQQFESGVKQSLSTLDKLKAALKFDKGFEDSVSGINKAVSNVKMDTLGDAVEKVSQKFSALEVVGITALVNITNKAMYAGERLVKSLSIDQITAGFSKYATITQSVQTILAATGEDIDTITRQVERLNWFTDETSYNLADMTANIAKFTSNGIKLEDATTQMIGIANAAALSGANAEAASHAMEGFSKAIASNKMDNLSWNWIKTAKMDTMQFKQSLIDAAVEVGTLKKAGDGIYKTLENNEVSVTNFNAALKDGWANAKVMTTALETYGTFANNLYDVYNRFSNNVQETSTWLEYIEEYKNGTIDIVELSNTLQISAEETEEIMKKLTDTSMALGDKAFRAGQEAKTFEEAVDSVKDAVSTGWMVTFQTIFGNYEEAKKLWTDLAEVLYNVFATSGNVRNAVLSAWRDIDNGIGRGDGRTDLLKAFSNLIAAINQFVAPIRDAWNEIFYGTTNGEDIIKIRANRLKDFTESLVTFTTKLALSETTIENLKYIAKAVFAIIRGILTVVGKIGKTVLPPIIVTIKVILSLMIIALGQIAKLGAKLRDLSKDLDLTGKALAVVRFAGEALLSVLYLLYLGISKIIIGVSSLVSKLRELGASLIGYISDSAKKGNKVAQTLVYIFGTISMVISGIVSEMRKIFHFDFSTFTNAFQMIRKAVVDVFDSIKGSSPIQFITNAFNSLSKKVGDKFGNIIQHWIDTLRIFDKVLQETFHFPSIENLVKSLGNAIRTIINNIREFFSAGENGKKKLDFQSMADGLKNFVSSITEFSKSVGPARIAAIAFSLAFLGLAGAVSKFFTTASSTVGGIKTFFDTLTGKIKKAGSKSQWLINLSIAIGSFAASLSLLSEIDKKNGNLEHVTSVFLKFSVSILALVGGLEILSSLVNKWSGNRSSFDGLAMVMVSLSGAILVAAAALKILDGVNTEGILAKVVAIGLIASELAAVSLVFGRFAPRKFALGTITLWILAASTKKIVESLAILNSLNTDITDDKIMSLLTIMVGLGLLARGIGSIGLGTVAGVFALCMAIDHIIPTLEKLSNANLGNIASTIEMFADKIANAILKLSEMSGPQFVKALTTAAAIGFGVESALKNLGKILIGLSVSLVALVYFFKEMSKISGEKEQFDRAIVALSVFLVLITVLVGVTEGLGRLPAGTMKAKSAAPTIIAVGLVLLEMIGLMKLMEGFIKEGDPWQVIASFGAVIVMLGVMGKVLQSLQGVSGLKFGTVFAIFAGLAFMFAEMAIFSALPLTEIGKGLLAIGGIAFIMGELFNGLANAAKHSEGSYKEILSFTAMFGAIIGGIILAIKVINSAEGLGDQKWATLLVLLGGMTLVIASVDKVMEALGKEDWKDTKSFSSKVLAIVSMAGIILAIGAAVKMMGGLNVGQIVSGIGMMSLALYAISEVLDRILKATKGLKSTSLPLLKAKILAVVGLSSVFIILGSALRIMGNIGPVKIVASLAAMTGVLYALVGVFAIMNKMKIDAGKIWSIAGGISITSLAFISIATSIWLLKDIDWSSAIPALISLGGMLVLVAAAIGILSKLESFKILIATGSLAIGLISMAGSLYIIGLAFEKLSKIDWNKDEKIINMAIGTIVGITVIFGLLAGIAGATEGTAGLFYLIAVATMIALAGAIALLGAAMLAAGYGISVGTDALIKLSKFIKDDLPPEQAKSAAESLASLSSGLVSLGLAGIPLAIGALGIAYAGRAFTSLAEGLKALNSVGDGDTGVYLTSLAEGLKAFAEGMEYSILKSAKIGIFALALMALAAALKKLMDVDLSGIVDDLDAFADAIVKFSNAWLKLLAADAGLFILILLLPALSMAIEVLTVALTAVNGPLQAFTSSISTLMGVLGSGVSGAISGLGGLGVAVGGFCEEVTDAVNNTDFYGIGLNGGTNLVNGFSNGLNGLDVAGHQKIQNAGAGLAQIGKSVSKDLENVGEEMGRAPGVGFVKGNGKSEEAVEESTWSFIDRVGNVIHFAQHPIQTIVQVGASTTAHAATEAVENNVEEASSSIKETVKEKVDGVVTYLKDLIADLSGGNLDIFGNIFGEVDSENIAEGIENALSGITQAFSGVGGSGGGSAVEKAKDVFENLESTIKSAIDVFKEFDRTVDISADDMIHNLTDQLKGMLEWRTGLINLVEKGISPELYEYLANMGQKEGYGYVMALQDASLEQIMQLNSLWSQYLTLPGAVTNEIKQGYAIAGGDMGANITKGIGMGFLQPDAIAALKASAVDLKTEVVSDLWDVFEIHSPAKSMYETGTYITKGVSQGMFMPEAWGSIRKQVSVVFTYIKDRMTEQISIMNPYNIGKNITLGLANGIGDSEAVQRCIDNARHAVSSALGAAEDEADEASPSKKARKIGAYITEGLAIGISELDYMVVDSSRKVTKSAMDLFADAVRGVNDMISSDLGDDFNPVITPTLDLSNVIASASDIESIFNNGSYTANVAGLNKRYFTAMEMAEAERANAAADQNQNGGNSYTFNQYNTSPKALSRVDIYRETKNQFSRFREVTG